MLGRTKFGATASAVTAPQTLTFDETAALGNTHGIYALVRRTGNGAGAGDATPTNIAALQALGWTMLRGEQGTGSVKTWDGVFAIRGNNSINGITIEGPQANVTIALVSVNPVRSNTFWQTTIPGWKAESGNTSPTLSITTEEDDVTVLGFVALGGTFGTTTGPPAKTGAVWTGLTLLQGSSQFNSTSVAYAEIPAKSTARSVSVTWTTGGVNGGFILASKTGPAPAPTVVSETKRTRKEIDLSQSTGTAPLTLSGVSFNPTTVHTVSGMVISFVDDETRTTDIVVTYTVNGGGGSVTRTTTIAPASGGSGRRGMELLYQGGVLG